MTDTPKRGPGRPRKNPEADAAEPKAAAAEKVACEVLRDFWPEGGGRVRKGTVVDMDPMKAIDAIEAGAVRKVR